MAGTIQIFFTLILLYTCNYLVVSIEGTTDPDTCQADNNTCSTRRERLLTRPPHEMPRAVWQDTIPAYKPGPLTPEQVETFYRDGVLVLPDFYSPKHIDAIQADTERSISRLADKLYKAQRISSLYSELDWTERLLKITQEDPEAPIFLMKSGVLPPAFWDVYADPRMLDIATQLGLEEDAIALNPAWNLRAKMPKDEVTVVPWHQDNSYWEPRIWDELVLTVWVALVPATRANGCMEFVKGGHRSGKTAPHTLGTGATWYTELLDADQVSRELLDGEPLDILTCEVTPGTAILFPGTTPHRSLDSTEESVRWSTDFRLHNRKAVRPGKSELDWFYGLKDSIVVREKGNKDFKINWEEWAGVDRTEVQNENAGVNLEVPDFDPIVVGPWMDLWDVEKHPQGLDNPHIQRYIESLKDGDAELIQGYRERNNW
jgi:Phytanoyl-CoA dioxygenase (PhyH)